MELNVSEIHDTYPHTNTNYWETAVPPVAQEKRRKKVSFDDILSNMNLVVNQQGVLQYMTPTTAEASEEEYRQTNYSSYNPTQPPPYYNSSASSTPLDASVKHSYIYNKYFKNYSDPNAATPTRRVPKTIEEYRQMILEDRITAIQQKQRADQIKSRKMMFTSAPGVAVNPRNIQATKNGLRMMSFK
jgi:hypothetical protein